MRRHGDRLASLHGADRNLPESMLPPCAELRWMPLAATPLLVEACVHGLIRRKAPRTPICAVCLQGERDYQSIRGGTGPLVYPAGFLYLFSGLRAASGGGDIAAAQVCVATPRSIRQSDTEVCCCVFMLCTTHVSLRTADVGM